MADGVDTGNPNFFNTYKGRYEVELAENASSTSSIVMETCVNDVQFCGNFTFSGSYTIGDVIFTLPESLIPITPIYLPIPVQIITGGSIGFLVINNDGRVWASQSYDSPTFRLRGLSFNLACNFYS